MNTFKALCLAAAILTLSSTSVTAEGLYSEEFCETANFGCVNGSQLLYDNYGRCGCLKEGEYFTKDACIVSFIQCDELNGELFSSLSNLDGEWMGCGCFNTRE